MLSNLKHAELITTGAEVAIGLLMPASYVAAFVMAILGLLDIRKNRDTYSQGSKQAWWGLGISTVFLAIFGGAFYMGNPEPIWLGM